MAGTGRATAREAVAVFDDVGDLEAAVEDLKEAGFPEDAFSLLAADEAVERKLGHVYRRVEEVEDEADVPRRRYAALNRLGDREDRVASAVTMLPDLIAAGTVVGSSGPIAAAIAGLTTAGATLATVLSHFMNRSHADWLQEQLDRGGLLLWVRTPTEADERRAIEVLTRHATHDVHIHEVPAPPPAA
jgi:hypothetical protein